MDPYEHIVDLYDLEHDAFDDDASFYVNCIQHGPVLEVGCGTGRILARLAKEGLEVHGVDTSEAMLRAARLRLAEYPNAHLHYMSVESLRLSQFFQSVIWPLNVLWHLSDHGSQLRALRRLRASMTANALMVIDLSNPLTLTRRADGNEVLLRFQADDDRGLVQGFSCADDDASQQLLQLSLWYDRILDDGTVRRTTTHVPLRYTYRYELELLLGAAGFHVSQTYGSYDLDPYTAESPNLLVVASAS